MSTARALLTAVVLSAVATAAEVKEFAVTPSTELWPDLRPGATKVAVNASGLLALLYANTGDIQLPGNIILRPGDWQIYDLPILIDAPGETILVRSDLPGLNRMIDWGGAVGLLKVTANTTLALLGINSRNPGNRTLGVRTLPIEVRGSPLWPTVIGDDGHRVAVGQAALIVDVPRCTTASVQAEVARIRKLVKDTEAVRYLGGTSMEYSVVSFTAPLFDTITAFQVGTAEYALSDVNTTCFDSSYRPDSGGGTPSWVWAVVGSVAGVAVLAAVGCTLLWRRGRKRTRALIAATVAARKRSTSSDLENGKLGLSSTEGFSSKDCGSSNVELSGQALSTSQIGSQQSSHDKGSFSNGLPQHSDELRSQFLRTRFGPIDGVVLVEMLGRGAFGRVYRGRWKGAVVAVKVIDQRVQPGKTCDLSREPLLSMSVSHPNILITHKMCVVRVIPGGASAAAEQQEPSSPTDSTSGRTESAGGSGLGGTGSGGRLGAPNSSGKLVPALSGEGMVEVVSPHDVLQPGLYETWLVLEYCDRGSLADLAARGLPGVPANDPLQRDIWVLLCLMDIAQGLDYLHSSTIIHGDLKPANVLLKTQRTDRRGFVCKLADFGLSRMLGQEESHVETQSYGTASYAAPELLVEGKLTKAADIFSLGILMWELTAGQELYPGMTVMQILLQVSQHQMRPQVPEGCPPPLADLMQRCWSQDPAERPDAARVVDEIRDQLLGLLSQSQSQPPTPGGASQPSPSGG